MKTKEESIKIAGEKDPNKLTGNQGMIVPFWGEFLVSPSPLEWSLNYCSHGCAYCFANLNAPTRKGDASKAMRQIAEVGRRNTLTDMYLRSGYPVCVSNKTDPFSESNYREMVPVLQAMKEQGIPMQFQTKGGKGIEQVLDGLPPSVWYVTVCQSDDATRKRIEPNAPSIGERLDLIEQLTAEGHYVVVGVNPAVPEWLKDPGKLMEQLADHGALGVWIERLHLSHKQVNFMPKATQRNIGDDVIARCAAKRDLDPVDLTFLLECHQLAASYDLDAFTFTYHKPTRFFMPWRIAYKRTLPTIQDAANFYHSKQQDETRLISFDEFITVLEGSAAPYFPGKQRIGDYMRVVSYRTVETVKDWTDWMTFRQLLWFAWTTPGNKLSPTIHSNFAMAVTKLKDGDYAPLTDEKGIPYYVFIPGGWDERYFEFTGDLTDFDEVDSTSTAAA